MNDLNAKNLTRHSHNGYQIEAKKNSHPTEVDDRVATAVKDISYPQAQPQTEPKSMFGYHISNLRESFRRNLNGLINEKIDQQKLTRLYKMFTNYETSISLHNKHMGITENVALEEETILAKLGKEFLGEFISEHYGYAIQKEILDSDMPLEMMYTIIENEDKRLTEIAKFLVQKYQKGLKHDQFEVLKFCMDNGQLLTISSVIKNLESKEQQFQLFKYAAIKAKPEELEQLSKDAILSLQAVEDQDKMVEFALIIAEKDAKLAVKKFSFNIIDEDKLIEVLKACASNGAIEGVAIMLYRTQINDRSKLVEIYSICLQHAESNTEVELISKSPFFIYTFGLTPMKNVSSKVYNFFDFSKTKEKIIAFQKMHFEHYPFNEQLDEILKIEDLATRYNNLMLLAEVMIMFQSVKSDAEWLAKIILPAIFKFGKPSFKLVLTQCCVDLCKTEEGIIKLKKLTDNDPSWKKLACLLSARLMSQGVDSTLFTSVDGFRHATEKKGSIFNKKENAQVLIETLLYLVKSPKVSSIGKGSILKRLINEGDEKKQKRTLENMYALIAIINFRGLSKLKESETLEQTSEILFREKCPIGKVDDFTTKYQKEIGMGRSPIALITYAGKIDSLNDTSASKCLGGFATLLLNGTFRKERYEVENNIHLQTLERSSPGIIAKWQTSECIAESIDTLTINQPHRQTPRQSSAEWLRTKLIQDQSHGLNELLFLKEYLDGNDSSIELDETYSKQLEKMQQKPETKILKIMNEIKKAEEGIEIGGSRKEEYQTRRNTKLKTFEKEIKDTPYKGMNFDQLFREINKLQKPQEELLNHLRLQQECINWIKESNQLRIMEESQEPLTTIEGKMGTLNFHLENIKKIIQRDTVNRSEFLQSIKAKQEEMRNDRKTGFVIMETDDPIDLLLSGSDVADSCQHVDGSADVNKGLLGTLMDGKTRQIEIKTSPDRSGKIKARCLIRLMFDREKPVLFMEKVYSDGDDSKYVSALTLIAKRKALAMGIPLLQNGGKGKLYGTPLYSLGGPAPWEYSDGSGSNKPHKNGIYQIKSPRHVL